MKNRKKRNRRREHAGKHLNLDEQRIKPHEDGWSIAERPGQTASKHLHSAFKSCFNDFLDDYSRKAASENIEFALQHGHNAAFRHYYIPAMPSMPESNCTFIISVEQLGNSELWEATLLAVPFHLPSLKRTSERKEDIQASQQRMEQEGRIAAVRMFRARADATPTPLMYNHPCRCKHNTHRFNNTQNAPAAGTAGQKTSTLACVNYCFHCLV